MSDLFVDSVGTFVEAVSAVRSRWARKDSFWKPWFRGQRDASWSLRPRLYRSEKPKIGEYLEAEEELCSEFERRGKQLIAGEGQPQTHFEWYFFMQHFGVPTRLLDWTDGALAALYFAVERRYKKDDPRRKADAAVWALDPVWLNDKTFYRRDDAEGVALPDWDVAAKYLPERFVGARLRRKLPIAIDPPHVSRRLAVQRSRFTIHGTDRDGLDSIAGGNPKSRLLKICVRHDALANIRGQLEICGISSTTLFPDPASLGKELTGVWKWGAGAQ
jgi:hypothetical protein